MYLYIYISLYLYIYIMYAAVSNGKRKIRRFSLIRCLLIAQTKAIRLQTD